MKKLCFVIMAGILFTACTGERYAATGTTYDSKDNYLSKDKNRVVIYNATVDITVKNADTLNSKLGRIALQYEGYVVKLSDKQSTIRVPADKMKLAMEDIARSGKVKDKSEMGRDVTDEFKDYNIRLDNATKARERYLELLSKAENVEAALKVEKELERLNGEIEVLKGKIERIKHLSDYSTIEVNIRQKRKLGLVGYVGVGVYKAIKWLVVRG